MPYNTRRKSLSLPLLGIHVPSSSRASLAHRSPPKSQSQSQQHHRQPPPSSTLSPPSKKCKRSHQHDTASSSTSSSSASSTTSSSVASSASSRTASLTSASSNLATSSLPGKKNNNSPSRPKVATNAAAAAAASARAHTPPPSPGGTHHSPIHQIDTEGIKDDIVVAVIQQLEKTANKPHLVKELANVLQYGIPAVESSSNPAAIISSRLTTFLKRPWTALAKCPLGRELVGTHPKRTYFFLTTYPHQGIPDPDAIPRANSKNTARIISPSLSGGSEPNEPAAAQDAASDASDQDRQRAALSPSPEIDFRCPELEAAMTVDDSSPPRTPGTFPTLDPLSRTNSHLDTAPTAVKRGVSLERDEQDFTETAGRVWRQRSRAGTGVTTTTVPSAGTHTAYDTWRDISPTATRRPRAASDGSAVTAPRSIDHSMVDDLPSLSGDSDGAYRRDREVAALLFGPTTTTSHHHPHNFNSLMSDPAFDHHLSTNPIVPSTVASTTHPAAAGLKLDLMDLDHDRPSEDDLWGELASPEQMNVEDLDALFGEY